jgi:hypothetical protein
MGAFSLFLDADAMAHSVVEVGSGGGAARQECAATANSASQYKPLCGPA